MDPQPGQLTSESQELINPCCVKPHGLHSLACFVTWQMLADTLLQLREAGKESLLTGPQSPTQWPLVHGRPVCPQGTIHSGLRACPGPPTDGPSHCPTSPHTQHPDPHPRLHKGLPTAHRQPQKPFPSCVPGSST